MTNKLSLFDKDLFSNKIRIIAGIDEVGRGALAGPVVVGLVVVDNNFDCELDRDSKKLSKNKREHYANIIKTKALLSMVECVSSDIVDEINISNAVKLAINKLVTKASKLFNIDLYIIDYVKLNNDKINTLSIPKGDEKSQVVACASVIAKVYRDNLMADYDKEFPKYNFQKHVGYGTKEHLELIKQHGPTKIHRLTFKGVKEN